MGRFRMGGFSGKRCLFFWVNVASKQVVIPDTDHFFAGKEEAMVLAVKEFLDSVK